MASGTTGSGSLTTSLLNITTNNDTDSTSGGYFTTSVTSGYLTTGYIPDVPLVVEKKNVVFTIFASIVGTFFLAGIVTKLLHRYSNWRKTPWYALLTTWINWYFAVCIILLIPVDVSSSAHNACKVDCVEPWIHFSAAELENLWRCIYWVTFVMCWAIVPLMQSYCLAGHFHWYQRLGRALFENLAMYGAGAVVGIILIAYLYFSKKWEQLGGTSAMMNVVMVVSNSYGLVIVLALLGYGLTEWPKKLYRKTKREDTMRLYQFQSYLLLEEYNESRSELDKTLKLVKKYEEQMPLTDPNRKYLAVIISKCPHQYKDVNKGEGEYKPAYKDLVALHNRVLNSERDIINSRSLYEDLLRRAWNLQDVEKSKKNPNREIEWTFKKRKETKNNPFTSYMVQLQWIWRCHLQIPILYIGIFVCSVLSIMVVWSECTIFSAGWTKKLSVLYWITQGKENLPYVLQFALVFVPMSYVSFCAYWSLFRMRIFRFYRMIPHHNSDTNSILFNAYYLSRIIAPMAYNFLKIINDDNSAYYQIMGAVDLGDLWNIYFPMLLILLCLANLFNFYSRIFEIFTNLVSCCWKIKVNRFDYDEGFMDERVDKGKMIIAQEKDYKINRQALSVDIGVDLFKMKKAPREEIKKGNKWQTMFGNKWSKNKGSEDNLNSLELGVRDSRGRVALDDMMTN